MRFLTLPLPLYIAALIMIYSPAHALSQETVPESPVNQELRELKDRVDALELENLRLQSFVLEDDEEDKLLTSRSYRSGQRALQGLNPELSFTGDVYGQYLYSETGKEYGQAGRSGLFFRHLGLHLQTPLDPFTLTKVAIGVDPTGVHLGEAYATWTSLLPGVQLTIGQFRQQLGVVNRWHKHGLDQFDFPLMLLRSFGGGGLNQTGLSFRAQLPRLWAHNLDLTLEVTNGSNPQLFAGEFFSIPATLARLGNYWDISDSVYLEVGLTGMVGFNHHRGSALTGDPASEEEHDAEVAGDEHADHDHADTAVSGTVDEGLRTSIIAGFDLTLNWEPPNRSKYYYFTFRTEGLYIRKELADNQVLQWLGGYSSLEFKVSRRWILGFRGDLVQEFTSENQFAQLDRWEWQVAPYVTWWQSPWVRFRLEYDFHESLQGALDHRVLIQLTFAAGPHKHERY